ncbi:trypsin-1-like [Oratosquilla oratoria]|uniref:trypsin-1-like n=1 Tax=Oratosquilla oratoria TaxID=337810 RepID=UPI003F75DE42
MSEVKNHQQTSLDDQDTRMTTTSSTTTSSTPTPSCSCGKVNRVNRIVGGTATEVNEYPWQVGLLPSSGTRPFCGGTIINSKYIVTAAHCVDGDDPSDIRVVVGEHDYTSVSETDVTKRLSVKSIKVHENYNSNTFDNDIAIIELEEPIDFPSNNKIAPVCMPDTTTDYSNVEAIVSGWGTTSSGGGQPNVLHEVTVTTLTNTDCESKYSASMITDNMICAGDPNGGKDSCQGDSGGPLVTSKGEVMQLIGVVSWGYGCADARYPGVYAYVPIELIDTQVPCPTAMGKNYQIYLENREFEQFCAITQGVTLEDFLDRQQSSMYCCKKCNVISSYIYLKSRSWCGGVYAVGPPRNPQHGRNWELNRHKKLLPTLRVAEIPGSSFGYPD